MLATIFLIFPPFFSNSSTSQCIAWVFLRGLKILRPFLQFGCFSGALFVSLTRITDYRHHPEDVIVGILVGLFFATLILMFLADIFNRPRSFQVKYEQVQPEDHEIGRIESQKHPWGSKEISVVTLNFLYFIIYLFWVPF